MNTVHILLMIRTHFSSDLFSTLSPTLNGFNQLCFSGEDILRGSDVLDVNAFEIRGRKLKHGGLRGGGGGYLKFFIEKS